MDDPFDPSSVPFTAKDVCRQAKMPRSTVAGFPSELEDKGFLDPAEVAATGRGRPPKAWKPTGRDGEDVDALPPVQELFPEGGGNTLDKFPPPQPR